MINPKTSFFILPMTITEKKFGSKNYKKLLLMVVFTCPNRDGKTFHKKVVYSVVLKVLEIFAGSRVLSVTEQFEQMKEKNG